ncbi:hypothetical protein B9Z19DRAFT_1068939 [Tuber borchii]|uniref:Uncharacterized protein n=1 Tax=Tuber borchii TaxID=42251 RepID=A0A2T6ZDC1_TUBBO|nr:hypothetical protein B9Z19DRAFT_1068939 [Tuber borchii]
MPRKLALGIQTGGGVLLLPRETSLESILAIEAPHIASCEIVLETPADLLPAPLLTSGSVWQTSGGVAWSAWPPPSGDFVGGRLIENTIQSSQFSLVEPPPRRLVIFRTNACYSQECILLMPTPRRLVVRVRQWTGILPGLTRGIERLVPFKVIELHWNRIFAKMVVGFVAVVGATRRLPCSVPLY